MASAVASSFLVGLSSLAALAAAGEPAGAPPASTGEAE